MCQSNFTYIKYQIRTTPNPDNPNEQPVGNTLTDGRLYGNEVWALFTQGQAYNEEQYTHAVTSSALTSSIISFTNGQIVIALVKICNANDCIPS